MMKNNTTAIHWGMLHGINDWVAGYLLAHYALINDQHQSLLALILYAILAFGGQLPAGLWLDKTKDLKSFGILSIMLLATACCLAFMHPFMAIIVAGIGSAGIHVVGGCVCLMLNKEKITPLGIFTAPGVAGLTLGGFCAAINDYWLLAAFGSIVILFLVIRKNGFLVYTISKKDNAASLGIHDALMLLLLLVMTLRSFLFDLVNHFSSQFEYGLLIIGLSAFTGKIISGFFADRIGWKRWVFITLPLAFIFLQLGHDNIIMMAFGVACLQSSVPITLQLMYNSMPSWPATASAMSLGTIVAFAGLPLYASPLLHNTFSTSGTVFYAVITAVVILLLTGLALYTRQEKKAFTI